VSELVVQLCERRVGRLIRKDNGNLQFRYDPGYAGPSVSYALPLQAEAHPHGVTRAVFGGLLLEGDGRGALARALGLSPGNDVGLLEEVGGDCAGAITVLQDEGDPPGPPTSRKLDAEALDALLRELPQRPLAADPQEGVRLSLAGAQPKLPVIFEDDGTVALPTSAAAATTHILKPEPATFPGLVDNEPRFLRSLVLCWLIGNCDAHAKNFSLLYDAGAPTLAPLYDLVSTVTYPSLTTRLAMRIGAATALDEVDRAAWEQLARDIRVRPAFVRRTLDELLPRAAAEARRLIDGGRHDNPAARAIAGRITSLSA
jgi:HipA-like protein